MSYSVESLIGGIQKLDRSTLRNEGVPIGWTTPFVQNPDTALLSKYFVYFDRGSLVPLSMVALFNCELGKFMEEEATQHVIGKALAEQFFNQFPTTQRWNGRFGKIRTGRQSLMTYIPIDSFDDQPATANDHLFMDLYPAIATK